MFDSEDRMFLARVGLRGLAAVIGVLVTAGTLGLAWRIFWMIATG